MVLYESIREEEGEANGYGYEPTNFELRNDQTLMQYATGVTLSAS
jgi:hypothetical protein